MWQTIPIGRVSRKCRRLFGPEKPLVKLRPDNSVRLVFSYVVKGIKIEIGTKFRHSASRRLGFEDAKRIMSPEMRPKSLGTFEKRNPEEDRYSPLLRIKYTYVFVVVEGMGPF